MKPITTLIFDLDGTLLDTLDDLSNSVNYALKQYKFQTRNIYEIRSFLGNGIERLIRRSVPQGTSEELFHLIFTCFRSHYLKHCLDLTKPYAGIIPLLQELKKRGIKMAIVSNKLQPAVQELNQRFFHNYITLAVGESNTVRKKPNPDAVLSVLKELGSLKDETLYVGDSEVDVATANNANIKCACVTWGFRNKKTLLELSPNYIIDKPQELLSLLP